MTPTFFWDGTPLPFTPGETVADALMRLNRRAAAPVFCGIGQCQNCLVAVDGQGVREACLLPCAPDLSARPLAGPAAAVLRRDPSAEAGHDQ